MHNFVFICLVLSLEYSNFAWADYEEEENLSTFRSGEMRAWGQVT